MTDIIIELMMQKQAIERVFDKLGGIE